VLRAYDIAILPHLDGGIVQSIATTAPYHVSIIHRDVGKQNDTAPHNILAKAQLLLVVGCLCGFGVCTGQGMGLECAKGQ
jgi:hypothetical protein